MSDGALIGNLLQFAGVLRRAGMDVHTGRVLDAVTAIEWVGLRRPADVRAMMRALFVHRHADLAQFDRAFDLFWQAPGRSRGGLPLFSLGERPRLASRALPEVPVGLEAEDLGTRSASAVRLAVGAYSAIDVSRTKDFADFTPEEMTRAAALLGRLGWRLGVRRTRRWTPAAHGAIDFRRVLRLSLKHGGELVDLPKRDLQQKPRPIVVLADISGSMERYSRMLLHFVCGLSQGARRVESFLFATRLTRVTREAGDQGPAGAVERLSRAAKDWGGGTRIGEALRAFNVGWARRVMRNGPVMIVISDGWDRGDPLVLAREIARVRRGCRRLIWLNPLLGSANYEPLTRGMQAALPYVDDFLPAHNLSSLEELAAHLSARPERRSLPRQAMGEDERRLRDPRTWTSGTRTSSTGR
jgi:uncharacterized protein with von Willebrand factor type A (vWA) domain